MPLDAAALRKNEVNRRRTFAIISHPDAGKTTLTEKLLLYGGAIHLAGSVKARKAQRHATSDWMELERQRGISVTSSVLQFPYREWRVNLLDTPGHQDFSEDTYRTLTAVDSAVMLLDVAKGVEPQTRKLFDVCRMRGIPVFTLINKMDRHGKDPFALLDEIEQTLDMPATAVNWPIGMGSSFQGTYNLHTGALELYQNVAHGQAEAVVHTYNLADPELSHQIGSDAYATLRDETALLAGAGHPFDLGEVLTGRLTPVFFGSAINNFGIRTFFDSFLEMAPPPGARPARDHQVEPDAPYFSAFVFKIQANMNPAHRDRIAFVRVCSGRFEKGMSVLHTRLGKHVKLAQPQQFLAQERVIVEEGFAGDILGLFDPGTFRIGDTLVEGDAFEFAGIPHFSPEHFARLELTEPMKRKQLQTGLTQLAHEGAIQIFRPHAWGATEILLGAVGTLQFDVLAYRLENEYGAPIRIAPLPYTCARWVGGAGFEPADFDGANSRCVLDAWDRPVVLFRSDWALDFAARNHPGLRFAPTADALIDRS